MEHRTFNESEDIIFYPEIKLSIEDLERIGKYVNGLDVEDITEYYRVEAQGKVVSNHEVINWEIQLLINLGLEALGTKVASSYYLKQSKVVRYKIYQEGNKQIIERLSYPRFKGVVSFSGPISDIEEVGLELIEEIDEIKILDEIKKTGMKCRYIYEAKRYLYHYNIITHEQSN
jgi:hypothetical protein